MDLSIFATLAITFLSPISIFLGHASSLLSSSVPTTDLKDPVTRQNSRQREEELELIDQLRKVYTLPLSYTFLSDIAVTHNPGITCSFDLHIFNRINNCPLCAVIPIV